MTTPLIRPDLPIFTPRPRKPLQVKCDQFLFRQSFIQDYLKCPHYAMRRWIANIEEKYTFMATLLGTAGHEVLYRIHNEKKKKADVDVLWIISTFEEAFYKAMNSEGKQPKPTTNGQTIAERLNDAMPYYVDLIRKYQEHRENESFYCTGQEQKFVLPIANPDPTKAPYLFTGQIDQQGLGADGYEVLRDIKFRQRDFRYSRRELDLNIQLTMYAAAMRFGVPSCEQCAPRYETDFSADGLTVERTLLYNGPCSACNAIIGTAAWPNKFPVKCYMVWMFDLEGHKKDEFEREIIDREAPKKGRAFQRKINPDWMKGYKKGDAKGECFLLTYRRPAQIQAFMEDILLICDDIRRGTMYRRPSDNCNMCMLFDDCKDSQAIEAAKHSEGISKMYGSADPFGLE